MAKNEIHISDIRAFKSCRRKWNWSSPLRMNLERVMTYAPFFTGQATHYGLEQFYESGELPEVAASNWMDNEIRRIEADHGSLWEAERSDIEEQRHLVVGILKHYRHWARTEKGPFSDYNLRFMALETEFNVPMPTPSGRASTKVRLGGRFDGVVQKLDDGTYWIFETKTTRSITELTDTLQNDEQCGAYILAAQQLLNITVSGVVYNILRKKVPTAPEVLQNGYLSQRANLDSTAEAFYEYACEYHGRDGWTREQVSEHYSDYLTTLLNKGNQFFARVAVFRTPKELQQLRTDLWTVALEMTRKNTPLYPSPSWINCRFCSFRAPCYTYNSGGDVDFLFENDYRVRKPWEPLQAVKDESKETM